MKAIGYRAGFPGIVYVGAGSLAHVEYIVAKEKAQRVALLVDRAVKALPGVAALIAALRGRLSGVYEDIPPEPSFDSIAGVLAAVQPWTPDLVLGIGGGSVMDMAKVIAAALANAEYARQGFDNPELITVRAIPTVMVPTTAGTGAEATPNAIFLRLEQALKIGVVSDAFVASYVILDPCLTASLPPQLTATTGIDALCHAVESYISKAANPISRTFSLRAAELIGGSIEAAYADGSDMAAREQMLLGSFFAGMCLYSSTTVAVHALSYPLGGAYHIPHGLANAVLLPAVLEANRSTCGPEYTELARVMMPDALPANPAGIPAAFVAHITALCARLGIPQSLAGFGVTAHDVDGLVDGAFEVKRLLNQNPRELTKADIREIYTKLL